VCSEVGDGINLTDRGVDAVLVGDVDFPEFDVRRVERQRFDVTREHVVVGIREFVEEISSDKP
jgi:hypothetical protein